MRKLDICLGIGDVVCVVEWLFKWVQEFCSSSICVSSLSSVEGEMEKCGCNRYSGEVEFVASGMECVWMYDFRVWLWVCMCVWERQQSFLESLPPGGCVSSSFPPASLSSNALFKIVPTQPFTTNLSPSHLSRCLISSETCSSWTLKELEP